MSIVHDKTQQTLGALGVAAGLLKDLHGLLHDVLVEREAAEQKLGSCNCVSESYERTADLVESLRINITVYSQLIQQVVDHSENHDKAQEMSQRVYELIERARAEGKSPSELEVDPIPESERGWH